jgi:hypothetical protein
MKGKKEMKVYLYKEIHWDYSDTLGVLSEAAMLREKTRLVEEAKKKRCEEMFQRELEISKLKEQRRELSIKDQNENVPIQQALKASGDKAAVKAFRKQRKTVLKEIDRLGSQIWHLEWENEKLRKYEGDELIGRFFPRLAFYEYEVLE